MIVRGFVPYRHFHNENNFGLFQSLVIKSMISDAYFSSGTQCPLYIAASVGQHVIGPFANPPSHIILTPGRPIMFHGPFFILNTMQAGITTTFNVFGITWTQHKLNRESNQENYLISTRSP